MRTLRYVGILLAVSFIIAGCQLFRPRVQQAPSAVDTEGIRLQEQINKGSDVTGSAGIPTQAGGSGADDANTDVDETNSQNISEKVSFSGRILTGATSPVIDFNKADYDIALAANKNIVLYFYASWCPICKLEIPKFYNAFNRLSDENLVAFRVNFNDSDTDKDEEALARQFGVAYQHTKVFLKNGERILKSPESWDTNRYLSEIGKAF